MGMRMVGSQPAPICRPHPHTQPGLKAGLVSKQSSPAIEHRAGPGASLVLTRADRTTAIASNINEITPLQHVMQRHQHCGNISDRAGREQIAECGQLEEATRAFADDVLSLRASLKSTQAVLHHHLPPL